MTLAALNSPLELNEPQLSIIGQQRLEGELHVNGAKNSALVLMAASVLSRSPVRLGNMPDLTDIGTMAKILVSLGVGFHVEGSSAVLSGDGLIRHDPAYDLTRKLRASFFLIGPLLARHGVAKVPLPGGCRIGSRPVREHNKGLQAMGARISIEGGVVSAKVPGNRGRLQGCAVHLDCPSVGATETLMMAATLAEGDTVIRNAAQEPEVVDLAGLLKVMGARIQGAGSATIRVSGVKELHGADYAVMPDRIEAGTFLIAAAASSSRLHVTPVEPSHLSAVLAKLEELGCTIIPQGQGLTITTRGKLRGCELRTQPFPGFPTDLQAPFMALLTTAQGDSLVRETIFENRLQHVAELQRMGAQIRTCGNVAVLEGVPMLSGAPVTGTDLRAAAAMVIAGLAADGVTHVAGLEHLDRGYTRMEERLQAVGARISRTGAARPALLAA
ncbi:MAG: UDP-N-acetylglucosamine 1-carboxyvinyltransferase [Synechococcus sp. SB0668_bin_15]|nr:UDP-N-acetylglucosamine 1-carboxyvinyltransferase [Synechococcus sp. SB0668_bin_15]MXZ82150.1 UDP-N-acetylglucosamine 1-carboxyvinyltransferase [Synechococcus sp. SB0666_bin_14]MYA90319.1 UDP-N-acetylglucosamine 1-carboxyvinyltransferase [Synechococcus sp. SB0663_bin_10]MYC50106.1 UDP-N-acetylglucosamine 1-carboxyvinyltransferase [Synechococcus sp. SB0662_bin_14]MYG47676.1 UDP-N-acetylglucosamine 1-carboxyvinyltransferase [Synechococcus sp. SB0675_bin_6]MYJ60239.1 UDP-N-acetylglucosamine 1-